MLSTCGVNCSTDCKAYKIECEGCLELGGKVSWAVYYGQEHCPIYACAVGKGLESCAKCGKAPCEIWYSTQNPDATEEEFAADIASRLRNLKQIRE
ncbi:MAG: hypothetical protein CVU48_05055 [Candidatus Cloacimonetes bacterium HGW-Cloacimonetes-1]|jgi:hypothetical protein|nr:MAG: hypothetical protein CVU48_05055 [Candidatus Cloacimonetes bacterium HGW-Cloacimonetes-1]